MAVDPRKRQKRQERRHAKRKSKQQLLVRKRNAGLAERLTAASRYPILDCWETDDIWTQGIGYVGLSRELPDGSVAFAVFLVDRHCLGVKNAFAKIEGRFSYESQLREIFTDFTRTKISAPRARKFVEDAAEYARALGFQPHPDYHKAKLLFGDVDATECKERFEFGKDGKPFFVAGPYDTPARCRQILVTLVESCGVGRFDYLIPVHGSANFLPEPLRHERARLIGPDETGAIRDYEMDFSEDR